MSEYLLNTPPGDGGLHLDSIASDGVRWQGAIAAFPCAMHQVFLQFSEVLDRDLHALVGQERTKEEEGNRRKRLLSGDPSLKRATKKRSGGKAALFEQAGLLKEVEAKGCEELFRQLENRVAMMQERLEAMEKEEAFIVELRRHLDAFERDPTLENGNILIRFFQDCSGLDGKSLGEITLMIRFAMAFFLSPNAVESFAVKSENPGALALSAAGSQKLFERNISDILKMIREWTALATLLSEGKKTSLFNMEALLVFLEQKVIEDNANQAKDCSEMAKVAIQGLKQAQDKLKKALKKLEKTEHKHHGLFGWVADFFESLVKSIERIVCSIKNMVAGAITGNGQEAKRGLQELYDAMGAKGIEDAIKAIGEGLKTGDFSEVLGGLETLFTATLLVVVGGTFLLDTSFGRDLQDLVKLVTDGLVAFGEAVGAGVLAAVGDAKGKDSLIDSANKLGEEMLENPALQALAELVTVAMIVAAAVSQQYWLATLMVFLLVMTESGLMKKAVDGLTKLVEEIPGMHNSPWARVVADLLVIAAITLLSCGLGSVEAAGEVAAEEGAGNAGVMGEMVADEAVEEAAEVAAGIEANGNGVNAEVRRGAWKRVRETFVKAGKKIGPRGGRALVALGMTLGSTSLGTDLARAIDRDDQKLQLILTIMQQVVAAVAAVAGGMGISSAQGLSGMDRSISDGIEKALPKFSAFLRKNAGMLAEIAFRIEFGSILVGSLSDGAIGGNQILTGTILRKTGDLKGEISQFEQARHIEEGLLAQNSSRMRQKTKAFDQIKNTFAAPALAGEGIARALLQSA